MFKLLFKINNLCIIKANFYLGIKQRIFIKMQYAYTKQIKNSYYFLT